MRVGKINGDRWEKFDMRVSVQEVKCQRPGGKSISHTGVSGPLTRKEILTFIIQ